MYSMTGMGSLVEFHQPRRWGFPTRHHCDWLLTASASEKNDYVGGACLRQKWIEAKKTNDFTNSDSIQIFSEKARINYSTLFLWKTAIKFVSCLLKVSLKF